MLILIDGPEKAGKTTLIHYLATFLRQQGHVVDVTHHSEWDPDDRVIAPLVKEHSRDQVYHIWDRGWPSEEVYSTLLNRKHRANKDPFLVEWLHGRATPYKFILDPKTTMECVFRRDASDHKVNVDAERHLFKEYSRTYGYTLLQNGYTSQDIHKNVHIIGQKLAYATAPHVYGNLNSKVWFVATKDKGCKGDRWMPLSYEYALNAFRDVLGPLAMQCAFMFARLGNPAQLTGDKEVTAIGGKAADWVRYYVPASSFPKLHRLRKYDMGTFQTHLLQLKEHI